MAKHSFQDVSGWKLDKNVSKKRQAQKQNLNQDLAVFGFPRRLNKMIFAVMFFHSLHHFPGDPGFHDNDFSGHVETNLSHTK